jgi:glycosyltransferase involved in cell wall biosynthesis
MNSILYISLTGMTEPLGRSQVLEYIIDLSKENKFYLISFEREHDFANVDGIKDLIKGHDIEWQYMVYSNKHGMASTISQLWKAVRLGSKLIKKHSIDIVHARSMIPAIIGLFLKKMYGIRLLFDIRGFAIDEKVDSGRLQKSSLLYITLKKLDNYLYRSSDHIVTLTHVAKEMLYKKLQVPSEKITVIPTCASKKVFRLLATKEKNSFKSALGYAVSDKIILHTGTVSLWYDFESEVKLAKEIMRQDENIHFLVLNKSEQTFIQQMFDKYEMPPERVKISASLFDEVHKYLNIADTSLFFIKPSYSKQASAPTKFAENVACHLPSITNADVGDMGWYLNRYDVGIVVDVKKLDDNIEAISLELLENLKLNKFSNNNYKKLFAEHFDKDTAVKKYNKIYRTLKDIP